MLATQNPLEQEGTYPLPEAQLDRFLLYIKVDYPSGAEEWEIARRVTGGQLGQDRALVSRRRNHGDAGAGHARAGQRPGAGLRLGPGAGSRPGTAEAPEFIHRWVAWGAGPRGVLTLVTCAKARAILHGRYHATIGDVQAVAKPALRHRIAGNYAAQANNLTSDKLIDMLLEAVPADRKYDRAAASREAASKSMSDERIPVARNHPVPLSRSRSARPRWPTGGSNRAGW